MHHSPDPDCVVVGGGPGGMFLALLLARQGVRVTLLEAHHDFDRDFRGDTIHPTTLDLLDHLGLTRALRELPHDLLRQFRIHSGDDHFTIADFGRLPVRFPYIMLLSQAKLLNLLAQYGTRFPNLRLEMNAQVSELIREQGRVRGVVFRRDNVVHEVRACLTVAADGRFSKLRKLAHLEPIRTAPPMDVVWFRLPRLPSDPTELGLTVNFGKLCVLLAREDLWQIGFVIPKGGYQQLRAGGIEAFHQAVLDLVPWFGDRIRELRDWGQMTLLAVESSRLRKWYVPGMLLIGDAAHVMSPVGGVGINYAVQDAIAAANILTEPLRTGQIQLKHLAAIQQRREWPVRVIQFIQGLIQRNIIAEAIDRNRPFKVPLPLRILLKVPVLRDIPTRIIGLGIQREHVRPPLPGI